MWKVTQKKMQLILLQSKKAKPNQLNDGVFEGDKFEFRSSENFLEEFSSSDDLSNFFSKDQILSTVSDEAKKILMNSITKKHKERDDNIKSSNANSDDESLNSKILHHVPEK